MTLVNADFLRKIEKLEPNLKDVLYPIVEVLEKPREESIGRIEFDDLKDIVKDIAKTQARTEKRLEELAKAQDRTEKRVEELAKAQGQTEKMLKELTKVVMTLAEDQKSMKEDQKDLVVSQKKMAEDQKSMKEGQKDLAVSQKKMAEDQKSMKEELGGLGITVGYTLENEAYKKLPILLEEDYGIRIKQKLTRKYVRDKKGKAIEVNIFGRGDKDGKEVTIIGEAKAQLSNNKVDEFLRKKVKRLEGVFEEVYLVLVTHMITSPEVEEYVKEKGIALYYSYDF